MGWGRGTVIVREGRKNFLCSVPKTHTLSSPSLVLLQQNSLEQPEMCSCQFWRLEGLNQDAGVSGLLAGSLSGREQPLPTFTSLTIILSNLVKSQGTSFHKGPLLAWSPLSFAGARVLLLFYTCTENPTSHPVANTMLVVGSVWG